MKTKDRAQLDAPMLREPLGPLHPALRARARRVVQHHAPDDADQLLAIIDPQDEGDTA